MVECKLSLILILLFATATTLGQTSAPQLVFEWTSLDYDWPSPTVRMDYINSGNFIIENNALAGVKVWNSEYYVTVPRWRPGVPSTLNKVVSNGTAYILQPYPSWEMQEIGNASALQFVQSMEIDSRGWMWMLDVGRLNILASNASLIVNGAPKIIIWDMNSNCAVREFVFPDDVMPYNASWANDIVVDERGGFAYISDTTPTGGIIIYDFNRNEARRFDDPTMQGVEGNNMTVNGTTWAVAPMGTDGIALSHDAKTLYYCDISRENVYAIATEYLQNFQMPSSEISKYLQNLGVKGYSDGMTYTSTDALVYGSEAESAVYLWNVHQGIESPIMIAQNNDTMEWIDTFGWDDHAGVLVFTSNKLLKWLNNVMKFDGSDGPNFRVWTVSLPDGARSYMNGVEPVPKELPCLL